MRRTKLGARIGGVAARVALVAGFAAAWTAPQALAQVESPLLSKVQVNLVNPGGKSLAMGGAFVSVADDATAAIANPAGLPQLSAWQLGASGKYFGFEPRLDTGNFVQSGSSATLNSTDVYEPSDNVGSLEFASLVIPVVQDVTLAVYRNVNLRYQLDASSIEIQGFPIGNYRNFFINRGVSEGVSLDEQGGLDLQNEQYGLSAGARFGVISVGAGITVNKLRFDLTGGAAGGPHAFIANDVNRGNPSARDQFLQANISSSVDSGRKVGWNAGFRVTLDEARNIAIGGVYRKNPEYDLGYSVNAFNAAGTQVASFSCDAPLAGTVGPCGTFRVPDDFSFGISGRPIPQLLVAIEVQRVLYSQMNDGYVPIFAYAYPFPTNDQRAITIASTDDGTLPRVGAEFTIPLQTGSELNIRAGYFHEPAHGTKVRLAADANRDRQPDTGSETDVPGFTDAFRISYNGGQSENHISGGIGATLGRRFSVDLAADFSKTTKSYVLSAFVRF